ncbi:Trace amine-associated receptor 5 [Trichoplax sp. H2]|nr:Trace amine-associated receptor 5 [Trichoplax sp. H2]|eukprot:RDD40401.1 Trace amine-associated receptor 5 [Trichoplax sp. H2]
MDPINVLVNVSNHSQNLASNISQNQSYANAPVNFMFMIPALSIISVIAIIANIFCLTTIYHTPSLHDISNVMIANLAIIDLLTGMTVIPTIITVLLLGNETPSWLCKLQGFLTVAMYGASLFAIVGISIDRFRAVTRPYHYSSIITKTIIVKLLMTIPIPIIVASLPLFNLVNHGFGSYIKEFVCWSPACRHNQPAYISSAATAVFIVICIGIVLFCYITIFIIAYHKNKKNIHLKRNINIKSIRTTALIVGTNLICFLPQLSAITSALINCNNNSPEFFQAVFYTITLSNSALNPIVYISTNSILRRKLVQLMLVKALSKKDPYSQRDHLPQSRSLELSNNTSILTTRF